MRQGRKVTKMAETKKLWTDDNPVLAPDPEAQKVVDDWVKANGNPETMFGCQDPRVIDAWIKAHGSLSASNHALAIRHDIEDDLEEKFGRKGTFIEGRGWVGDHDAYDHLADQPLFERMLLEWYAEHGVHL
jgi:hypothetical protein